MPRTGKYEHVKSTIKHGKTVHDVDILSENQPHLGDKIISKRRQETFKRIKRSTLAKMLEVGLELTQEIPAGESIYQRADGEENKQENNAAAETESVYSMQSSMTRFSAVTYATDQLGITVIRVEWILE